MRVWYVPTGKQVVLVLAIWTGLMACDAGRSDVGTSDAATVQCEERELSKQNLDVLRQESPADNTVEMSADADMLGCDGSEVRCIAGTVVTEVVRGSDLRAFCELASGSV
jgi:hypothetical protein